MFGLFNRGKPEPAPEEPIEITASIQIARPAAEVYALLDFADERHQLRARGNEVRQVESDPPLYRLWYDLAPDLNFLFAVTEAEPERRYAYSAIIVPPIGLRTGSHEDYTIEPLGEEACRLTFVNTVHHVPGISSDELAAEVEMSSVAAANSLAKLKMQAEEGVAAVAAFERELGQR